MHLKLPELGEGVHEGELVKWLVKEGDSVKDDQPLAEIMTDKATVELPSPFTGKVTQLMAKEGQTVTVGQEMLAYESAAGAGKAEAQTPKKTETTPAVSQQPVGSAPTSPTPQAMQAAQPTSTGLAQRPAPAEEVRAAPSTRRFAREMGVDIARVPGSGPSGRIMREDVERATSGGAGAVAAGAPMMARGPMPSGGEERIPFKGLRKKISEKMRESKDKAAHFTYVEEADATELVNLRKQAKDIGAQQGVKVTFLPFILKAMAATLKHFPILNSTLDEQTGEIVIRHYYNIGISVQTDDGLTVVVVKDVQHKSVLQIAKEIQELVERARTKRATREDLTGGTITLTNAGSIGGLFATPVINFPEVAILGFNKIFRKPVVKTVNGREEIVVRDWTYFSISLDHRIVDGAVGAEFMNLFVKYIENPSLMLLEA